MAADIKQQVGFGSQDVVLRNGSDPGIIEFVPGLIRSRKVGVMATAERPVMVHDGKEVVQYRGGRARRHVRTQIEAMGGKTDHFADLLSCQGIESLQDYLSLIQITEKLSYLQMNTQNIRDPMNQQLLETILMRAALFTFRLFILCQMFLVGKLVQERFNTQLIAFHLVHRQRQVEKRIVRRRDTTALSTGHIGPQDT